MQVCTWLELKITSRGVTRSQDDVLTSSWNTRSPYALFRDECTSYGIEKYRRLLYSGKTPTSHPRSRVGAYCAPIISTQRWDVMGSEMAIQISPVLAQFPIAARCHDASRPSFHAIFKPRNFQRIPRTFDGPRIVSSHFYSNRRQNLPAFSFVYGRAFFLDFERVDRPLARALHPMFQDDRRWYCLDF